MRTTIDRSTNQITTNWQKVTGVPVPALSRPATDFVFLPIDRPVNQTVIESFSSLSIAIDRPVNQTRRLDRPVRSSLPKPSQGRIC